MIATNSKSIYHNIKRHLIKNAFNTDLQTTTKYETNTKLISKSTLLFFYSPIVKYHGNFKVG